ncbi:MAG: hypothetical protein JHC25_03135, partial [Thermodesulfobacterium sp.]|nr:hypothetical protein [Thermodesulfobacterium sp.]
MDNMREKVIKEILREYGLVFHIKYVYCRKDQCRKCPHGPYLYASRREGGKVKTVYLGKLDSKLLAKREKVIAKIQELLDE